MVRWKGTCGKLWLSTPLRNCGTVYLAVEERGATFKVRVENGFLTLPGALHTMRLLFAELPSQTSFGGPISCGSEGSACGRCNL